MVGSWAAASMLAATMPSRQGVRPPRARSAGLISAAASTAAARRPEPRRRIAGCSARR